MDAAFAQTVRRARRRLRLTQAELAARLGVAPNTIARWERGERHPAVEQLIRRALGSLRSHKRAQHGHD